MVTYTLKFNLQKSMFVLQFKSYHHNLINGIATIIIWQDSQEIF